MPTGPTPSVTYKPKPAPPEAGHVQLGLVTVAAGRALEAEPYEFTFASARHAVILSLAGARSAGQTRLDGTPACASLVFRNTCLVVPAGAALNGWSSPQENHEYVALTFDPAFSASLEGPLAHATLRPELCFHDHLLTETARALHQEATRQTDFGRLWTDTLTNLVFTRLLTRNSGQPIPATPARGGLGNAQFRAVTDFLQDHIDENIPLSDLAALAGLSLSHFSRAFRTSAGMPPHLWLLRRRIERAQSLLGDINLHIAEVAARCGFSDQSHLTKVFRSTTGLTPLQWRRQGFGVGLRNAGTH